MIDSVLDVRWYLVMIMLSYLNGKIASRLVRRPGLVLIQKSFEGIEGERAVLPCNVTYQAVDWRIQEKATGLEKQWMRAENRRGAVRGQ